MCFAGEFLGASKIADSAPGVDQVGGGPERVHVIVAQIVTVPLEHMLALLQRVPVMAGLAQRGRKPVACVKPEGFSRPPIASNALATSRAMSSDS